MWSRCRGLGAKKMHLYAATSLCELVTPGCVHQGVEMAVDVVDREV